MTDASDGNAYSYYNYVAIFRSKYSGIPYTSASTGRSKVGVVVVKQVLTRKTERISLIQMHAYMLIALPTIHDARNEC